MSTCIMFMTLCERLQAVELVSPSAVEAVLLMPVDMNSVTTNDCRQLVRRVAAVLAYCDLTGHHVSFVYCRARENM